MKMTIGTRIIFSVVLLLFIALCAFLLTATFEPATQRHLSDITATITSGEMGFKILYVVIFAIIIILCIKLLFFGTSKSSEPIAKIAEFECGSIVITVKAIEELVEKFVRETKEVNGIRSKVLSFNTYINIYVEINVLPDSDIPALTKALQKNLAEYIAKHTGLFVKETKITVLATSDRISPVI